MTTIELQSIVFILCADMFRTISERDFPFISGASPRISERLGCLSLCSQTHAWFLLSCEVRQNGLIEPIVLMFSSSDQVVETFTQCSELIHVKQATIASPPAVNGSAMWKYEPLIEIARGAHKISGEIYLILGVENGNRYLESEAEAKVDELIGIVPVLRFGNQRK